MFYLYSPEGATISLWQRHIGWISQIFPIHSRLAPSFGMTPFELMEKLYGSWNYTSCLLYTSDAADE